MDFISLYVSVKKLAMIIYHAITRLKEGAYICSQPMNFSGNPGLKQCPSDGIIAPVLTVPSTPSGRTEIDAVGARSAFDSFMDCCLPITGH
jgi:hypothetical protein